MQTKLYKLTNEIYIEGVQKVNNKLGTISNKDH